MFGASHNNPYAAELEGIGRKIWITSDGSGMLWEGCFSESELNGFGRRITVRNVNRDFEGDNDLLKQEPYSYEIGFWKKGVFEGYGQKHYELETKEGIWKGSKLVKPKD